MAQPDEKQALLLWTMLTAETAEARKPKQSEMVPNIGTTKRDALVRDGYLEREKQGRVTRLLLTDKAWAWAANDDDVRLVQSNSKVGAVALTGLIHRLIPFLRSRGIPLAEVLVEPSEPKPAEPASTHQQQRSVSSRQPSPKSPRRPSPNKLAVSHAGADQRRAKESRISKICRELNAERPGGPIRLTKLRSSLSSVPREVVDAELRRLHDAGKLVLYREDNSAAITTDDESAALFVGGAPRHLLYWKE